MENLAIEKCSACRGDEPAPSPQEIVEWRQQVPEWELTEAEGQPRLTRTFKFSDFLSALDFTRQVGEMAETQGHHPAILTEWGKVTVTWWTHATGGVHRNDFIAAAHTSQIYEGS